jgi:hypothetical protein
LIHPATLSTGITDFAPLYKAAAMVEVALSTSIITTVLSEMSYRFNNDGDNTVFNEGISFLPDLINRKDLF